MARGLTIPKGKEGEQTLQRPWWKAAMARHRVILLGSLGVILILVAWQLISRFKIINPFFISSPIAIAQQFKKSLLSGIWFQDLMVSLSEFMVAYALSVAVGIPLGFLVGWYKYAEYFFDPYVWLLYATPTIAHYPVFIALLGLGSPVVILLAFLASVIQIYSNTYTGVKTVNPIIIRIARSFGAGDREIFYKIAIPAAIPMIIAGLRLAVGRALLGVVIGELFGANQGVGFRLGYTAAKMQVADYFVALLTVVFFGVLLSQALLRFERLFAAWRTD